MIGQQLDHNRGDRLSDRFNHQLDQWRRVSLDELNERAPLLDRSENKYVVATECIQNVLDDLRNDFDVLGIEGRTVFTYDTAYYDTEDLLAYRQHAQGKRRRLKIRSRRYVDTGLCFFEVKMKGTRGRTIKRRAPYGRRRHGAVDPMANAFITRSVNSVYGETFKEQVDRTLSMRYRRLTLVGRGRPERVTIDFDLEFFEPGGAMAAAPEDTVIVEVKSENGRGVADAGFHATGARPVKCSKYCIGLNLVYPDLPGYNVFKRSLVGHFGWTPPNDTERFSTSRTEIAEADRQFRSR